MSLIILVVRLSVAVVVVLSTLATARPMQGSDRHTQPTLRPAQCVGTLSITFDDGPDSQLTIEALDILLMYDVKATFFVVGQEIEGNEHIIQRMVAEGHSVQNHTYTHPFLSELTPAEVADQIQLGNQAIVSAGAPAPIYFRPPYDNYDEQTLKVIEQQDLHNVTWTYSLDVRDWDGLTVGEIEDGVLGNLVTGGVILFHDTQPNTIKALPNIIEGMHREGYCINLYQGEDFWILDT